MHVILIGLGSAGDVHPFVGIGQRLLARGHRATLLAPGYFEPLATRAGLEFGAIGTAEEYRELISDPRVWDPVHGFRVILQKATGPAVRTVYDLLMAHQTPGDTVVVASSLALGARVAQDAHAIPTATVHLSPAIFRCLVDPPAIPNMLLGPNVPRWLMQSQYWLIDVLILDRLLQGPVGELRRELGLSRVRRLLDRWWHSPQLVLGLFPDWFAQLQPDWPPQTLLTGFPLYDESGATPMSAEVEEFLAAGEPPVVFTPGSAMYHGQAFFEAAADACRRTGRRGILLTRFAHQLPQTLPSGVRHFDFVPFSALLPRAAALVHHGGIGSTSQALAAGVPQLVMAMAFDQLDNARRVQRLGVGMPIRPRDFQGPQVASALDRLLALEGLGERCSAAAARLAGDRPLERACDAIERLALMTPRSIAPALSS